MWLLSVARQPPSWTRTFKRVTLYPEQKFGRAEAGTHGKAPERRCLSMCPPKRCCCCPLYEGVQSWFVILSVTSCFGALLSFGSAKWANEMLRACEEMEALDNAPVPWSPRRNDSTGPGAEGDLPLFVEATVCEPQFADKATCQQPACIDTLDAKVVAGWVEVFISIVYCTVRRRTPVEALHAARSCSCLTSVP